MAMMRACESCRYAVHYSDEQLEKGKALFDELMKTKYPFTTHGVDRLADLAEMKDSVRCARHPKWIVVGKQHWCGEFEK